MHKLIHLSSQGICCSFNFTYFCLLWTQCHLGIEYIFYDLTHQKAYNSKVIYISNININYLGVQQLFLTDFYYNIVLNSQECIGEPSKQRIMSEMKQSHIYERMQRKGMKRNENNPQDKFHQANMSNIALNREQFLDGMFRIMQFLITRQQKIQAYKQLLTERSDFNPETLYYYISRGEDQIDKRHILTLLQQNQISATQELIKTYLNSYGYKDRFDYSAFVNLIFPVDVSLLKYISVTGIKKYSNQTQLTQQVLCIFYLLIQEEIAMIQELNNLKNELQPKHSRKQVKNIMKIMKKNGQCNSQMQIQSQQYVKYDQLKTLFKNLISKQTQNLPNLTKKSSKKYQQQKSQTQNTRLYSMLQKNLPCIFRKLSMAKNNFINLEDLEFWLRPWTKLRTSLNGGDDFGAEVSNIFFISGINEIPEESNVTIKQDIDVPLSHLCY